jgi:hypothetical protein
MLVKTTVFWDVVLCSLVEVYRRSEVLAASIIRAMSKFYQTTWRNIPEDSHLHTCHHKNLKSHHVGGLGFPSSVLRCHGSCESGSFSSVREDYGCTAGGLLSPSEFPGIHASMCSHHTASFAKLSSTQQLLPCSYFMTQLYQQL